jgi:hypothetical protein
MKGKMKSFKLFLLNEALHRQAIGNEAVIVLRKVIDMVDDGHVDYSDNKIHINIGTLIHDKKYNNLDMFIVKSDKNGMQIGRHSSEEKHAIVILTPKLPQRDKIDDFLEQKERVSNFKSLFVKFVNDAVIDVGNVAGTRIEQGTQLNTREEFEKLYNNIIQELEKVFSQYLSAKKDIYNRIDKASNEMGQREILKASALKLRKEMLGSTVEEFKKKAIEIIGPEKYKLLNKEFREKLDSRLESFYEHKVR